MIYFETGLSLNEEKNELKKLKKITKFEYLNKTDHFNI